MSAFIDRTGFRYNKLTVISKNTSKKGNYWNCLCDCGTTKAVSASNLATNAVKSCGCTRRKPMTHGMTYSIEYVCWCKMKERCNNPSSKDFKYYGSRGISVCDEWNNSFEEFFSDMGKKPSKTHSIDRIDNSKGYYPNNCKWATKSEQANNTRQNLNITIDGCTKTASQWANTYGISKAAMYQRLHRGWSPIKAITTPVRRSCSFH